MSCSCNREPARFVPIGTLPKGALDRGDLEFLAIDLPHLRRPERTDEGPWDVERFRGLPPALRAVTGWYTVRAEINNGGVDQLVWNQFAILPELIEAFAHIGARASAALLAELGAELLEAEPELATASAVDAFMTFRRRVDTQWSDDGDVLSDVSNAILRHAREHPEEYVLELAEQHEWFDGVDHFRSRILRRPDHRYEIAIDKRIDEERDGATAWFWSELPRPAEIAQTVDAARTIAERERARRTASPTVLQLAVTSCSSMFANDGSHWLWPSVPVDRLPQDARLTLLLRFADGTETNATGRFHVEKTGDTRCRGNVILDPGATLPPDERTSNSPPWWGSGWKAECRIASATEVS